MSLADAMNVLAGVVVVGFGLFLNGLGLLCVARPAIAEQFLGSFASSALTHYVEQGARLLVGTAFLVYSDSMRYPEAFRLFGGVVVVSTLGLLVIPWQWHHRFSSRVMPPVYRYLWLFGLVAVALATVILYSVAAGAS